MLFLPEAGHGDRFSRLGKIRQQAINFSNIKGPPLSSPYLPFQVNVDISIIIKC
jgi:hypothetical protein